MSPNKRALDLAYALAYHRQERLLGESPSQSAARIQMMTHYRSKACQTPILLPIPGRILNMRTQFCILFVANRYFCLM